MYVDLSHRLSATTPPFPGDIPVELTQIRRISEDRYNNYCLHMSVHTGTHIDTPRHFFDRPGFVADDPVEQFCGRAVVFDGAGQKVIGLSEDMKERTREGDIVLIRTGFDARWGEKSYFEDYPTISDAVADFLVERKTKIFGIDSPGPDHYPYPTHVKFFNANIYILENLCGLDALVGKDDIEMFAFPLKLQADSSPVRVVARIRD